MSALHRRLARLEQLEADAGEPQRGLIECLAEVNDRPEAGGEATVPVAMPGSYRLGRNMGLAELLMEIDRRKGEQCATC